MPPKIQQLGRTIRAMGLVMRLVRRWAAPQHSEAHNCSGFKNHP